MTGLHEVFQEISRALRNHPGKLRGYDGLYQFIVTGDGGGNYYILVDNGQVEVGLGMKEKSNISISVSIKDLFEIYEGHLDGMVALLRGKVQVRGDLALSAKLPALWRYLMEAKP